MNEEEKKIGKTELHSTRPMGLVGTSTEVLEIRKQSFHGCNNRTNYIGSAPTTMAMSAAEFRSKILTSGSSSRHFSPPEDSSSICQMETSLNFWTILIKICV